MNPIEEKRRVLELISLKDKLKAQGIKRHVFYIDLFAGAGGTTTGFERSDITVIACVNHDKTAIDSHAANHPDIIHFTEDILDFNVVKELKVVVDDLRRDYPGCVLGIWASLECTNHSRAKGGLPRDADSRTLACGLHPYLDVLKPDLLTIENVVEFQDWGPLDDEGHPIKKLKGQDYQTWVSSITGRGYEFDSRQLNAANFGAYTSRNRLFIQFAKGYPIVWPLATHGPIETADMFGSLKKFKPVRDCLELSDLGKSIFSSRKPYSDSTLRRLLSGLVKFVAKGDKQYLLKYFNYGDGSPHPGASIDQPCHTVTTQVRMNLVTGMLLRYNNNGTCESLEKPCGTLTTKDRFALANPFIVGQQTGDHNVTSVDKPFPTVTTVAGQQLAQPAFISYYYTNGGVHSSLEAPLGTITTNPKANIASIKSWLYNPQFGNNGNDIEKPCPTIIAIQEKKPLALVNTVMVDGQEVEQLAIMVYETDSPAMVSLKRFMADHGIYDIYMRMLKVSELKVIQGFPANYILLGNQSQQKKAIGNAVEVTVAAALAEAIYTSILTTSTLPLKSTA